MCGWFRGVLHPARKSKKNRNRKFLETAKLRRNYVEITSKRPFLLPGYRIFEELEVRPRKIPILRSVPNQDENPLISRNKGFTSGFWGLISEHKEGLGPHPSLISEIRGCTQVYLWCTRVYLYCTFAEIPVFYTAKYCPAPNLLTYGIICG